jgi:hypothetical protein
MSNITSATQFLNTGIAVIPIKYKDKRPDAQLLPKDADGHPTWEPYKKQLPTEQDLTHWFATPHNYGVVAGWLNLMMLDFDDANEYSRWRIWAYKQQKSKEIAETAFQVQTSRGVHVYLRCETAGQNRKIGKIDIKFRGYVLGPGSIHPTGVEYLALKQAIILPKILTLSEVLPAELLVQDTPTPNIQQPVQQNITDDPWVAAWQAQPAAGKGVVAKIKKTLEIQQFFTKTRKSGGSYLVTHCPFHDDKNPSFWIDTQKQICGCFSGCTSKAMDVIDLYARLYGLSNNEAIRMLERMV